MSHEPAQENDDFFGALLNDLETLQKARPVIDGKSTSPARQDEGDKKKDPGDQRIQAAADTDGDGDDDSDWDDDGDDGDGDDDDDDDGDEMLGKSFSVTMPNGEQQQAYDGTLILKSLHGQIVQQADTIVQLQRDLKQLHEQDAGLKKVLTQYTQMIKSMQADITELASRGRGRTSRLNVHDRPSTLDTLQQDPPAISNADIMAKARIACGEGKLTGMDIARLESFMNRGCTPPDDILSRI